VVGVVAVELLPDQDRGFLPRQLPVAVGVEVRQDLLEVAIIAARSPVLPCFMCANGSASSTRDAPVMALM